MYKPESDHENKTRKFLSGTNGLHNPGKKLAVFYGMSQDVNYFMITPVNTYISYDL